MAKYSVIETSKLKALATAVREHADVSQEMTVDGMTAVISGLPKTRDVSDMTDALSTLQDAVEAYGVVLPYGPDGTVSPDAVVSAAISLINAVNVEDDSLTLSEHVSRKLSEYLGTTVTDDPDVLASSFDALFEVLDTLRDYVYRTLSNVSDISDGSVSHHYYPGWEAYHEPGNKMLVHLLAVIQYYIVNMQAFIGVYPVSTESTFGLAAASGLDTRIRLGNLVYVDDYAYMGSGKLQTAVINGVKRVGEYAFADTPRLKEAYLDTVEEVGSHAFSYDGCAEQVDMYLRLGESGRPSVKSIGAYALAGRQFSSANIYASEAVAGGIDEYAFADIGTGFIWLDIDLGKMPGFTLHLGKFSGEITIGYTTTGFSDVRIVGEGEPGSSVSLRGVSFDDGGEGGSCNSDAFSGLRNTTLILRGYRDNNTFTIDESVSLESNPDNYAYS